MLTRYETQILADNIAQLQGTLCAAIRRIHTRGDDAITEHMLRAALTHTHIMSAPVDRYIRLMADEAHERRAEPRDGLDPQIDRIND